MGVDSYDWCMVGVQTLACEPLHDELLKFVFGQRPAVFNGPGGFFKGGVLGFEDNRRGCAMAGDLVRREHRLERLHKILAAFHPDLTNIPDQLNCACPDQIQGGYVVVGAELHGNDLRVGQEFADAGVKFLPPDIRVQRNVQGGCQSGEGSLLDGMHQKARGAGGGNVQEPAARARRVQAAQVQGDRVGAAEVRQKPPVKAGKPNPMLDCGQGEGHGRSGVADLGRGTCLLIYSEEPPGQPDHWLPPVSVSCVLHTSEECSCINF